MLLCNKMQKLSRSVNLASVVVGFIWVLICCSQCPNIVKADPRSKESRVAISTPAIKVCSESAFGIVSKHIRLGMKEDYDDNRLDSDNENQLQWQVPSNWVSENATAKFS